MSVQDFQNFVAAKRRERDDAIARFDRRQRRILLAVYTTVAILFVLGVVGARGQDRMQFDIVGPAITIDGHSIWINNQAVGLYGIDGPGAFTECERAVTDWVFLKRPELFACGLAAENALARIIAGGRIECKQIGKNIDGLVLARCFKGALDIAEAIALDGWAALAAGHEWIDHPELMEIYERAVDQAIEEKRGIWAADITTRPGWEKKQ